MPASARSLRVTDAYRDRLAAIRARTEALAERAWPSIEGLDSTDWPDRVASLLATAQTEAVRASSGYISAYLTSELRRRTQGPPLDSRDYSGLSRDGRPLRESLRSPIVGVYAALKDGKRPAEALSYGLQRARRMVEMDLMHAARQSLQDGMDRDPRIEGWQRAVRGTCGACLGDIAVEVSVQLPSLPLAVHPNCQCVTQPVVTGVPQAIALPTGGERLAEMSREEQDEQFGPDKAQALREGRITLADLVKRDRLATDQPDFITEKPLQAAE